MSPTEQQRKNGRCAARVYGSDHGFSGSPCSKAVKVEHGGRLYCATHDPEAVKVREAKKRARWAAEDAERQAEWKYKEAVNAGGELLAAHADDLPEGPLKAAAQKILAATSRKAQLDNSPLGGIAESEP